MHASLDSAALLLASSHGLVGFNAILQAAHCVLEATCTFCGQVPDEEEEEEEEKKKKNPDKDDPEKEKPDAPPEQE